MNAKPETEYYLKVEKTKLYNVYFTVFMIKSLELPYFRLKVMLFNFLWHELTRLRLVLKKTLSKFNNILFEELPRQSMP